MHPLCLTQLLRRRPMRSLLSVLLQARLDQAPFSVVVALSSAGLSLVWDPGRQLEDHLQQQRFRHLLLPQRPARQQLPYLLNVHNPCLLLLPRRCQRRRSPLSQRSFLIRQHHMRSKRRLPFLMPWPSPRPLRRRCSRQLSPRHLPLLITPLPRHLSVPQHRPSWSRALRHRLRR
jgi:hypothetical protein